MRTLVHLSAAPVNTLVTVSEQSDFERFVRARWGRDRGGIRGLARETGISAETLYRWFRGDEPELGSLRPLAEALKVRRFQLVAAFDGDGPVLPLAGEEARSLILDVVEQWAEDRGFQAPGQAPRGSAGAA